ncbi:hypothetical protein [Stenomitos frigidus]|nr:hypothetical protein [Stenomitos frigidus]
MPKDLLFAQHPLNLGVVPSPVDLPAHFPEVEMPRFLYGDRLQWVAKQDEAADWGIVIGRFYGFAPHANGWQWCYLIWLDNDAPSARWAVADTAWEADLEPKEREESV